jgi:hypothetical protein
MLCRRLLLFAVLCLGSTLPCAQAQVQAYERVGGDYLDDVLREHEKGLYLRVRPVGTRDTLWMWLQGSRETVVPDYRSAEHAELVVWCFPDRHPHQRHAMPDATKIAVKGVYSEGSAYLLLVDLSRREVPTDADLRSLLIQAAQPRGSPDA